MDTSKKVEILTDICGVSNDTISTIIGIYGKPEETLNDILYFKTGYRNFEDFYESEINTEDSEKIRR
jgi:cystathionine beta-lyase family protein involved in aluminum resistance